jgi:hypothetical protein
MKQSLRAVCCQPTRELGAARRCGQSRHLNAPNFDALIGQRRHECHELMTHARVDGFSVKKMMILLLRVPRIGTP